MRRFTHRERQVMALVAAGLLNKEVGQELDISKITNRHTGPGDAKDESSVFRGLNKIGRAASFRLRPPRTTFGSGHRPALKEPAPLFL